MTAATTAIPLDGAGPANGAVPMKKPAPNAPEHVKALYWRTEIVKLSRRELAELTGFSESSILNLERGHDRGTGKATDDQNMQRYRLACAAAMLGVWFEWGPVVLRPTGKVAIKVED